MYIKEQLLWNHIFCALNLVNIIFFFNLKNYLKSIIERKIFIKLLGKNYVNNN